MNPFNDEYRTLRDPEYRAAGTLYEKQQRALAGTRKPAGLPAKTRKKKPGFLKTLMGWAFIAACLYFFLD